MSGITEDQWHHIADIAKKKVTKASHAIPYCAGVDEEIAALQSDLPTFTSLDEYDDFFDAALSDVQHSLSLALTPDSYDAGLGRVETVLVAHRLLIANMATI
jgi:hypothetical protein